MRKSLLVTSLLIALALPGLANPSFETLQKQGDSFLAKKNYSQAVKTFEKLVYLYPTRADAYNALGYACFLEKRYDRSILVFRQALSYDPGNALAQKNLIVAVGKKAFEQTRELEFSEALSLLTSTEQQFSNNPQSLILKFSIGQLQFYRNSETEALASWRTVASRLPDSGTAKFMRAYDAYQASKYNDAIPLFKEAIAKVPEEAIFRNYYALCLADAGKLDLGLAQLQKAAQSNPPYLDLYLSQAQIYQKLGKLDEAVVAVSKGRNLRPDFASVHLWLASLFRAQNKSLASSRELGLAFAADKRPGILVQSQMPGAAIWVDQDRIGVTPMGVFVNPGKHRLKIQEKGKPALTQELTVPNGNVAFALASDSISVENVAISSIVPPEKPAPSFALRDQSNHYWRSFQHFHSRPVLLLFWQVGTKEVPESLNALSDLSSQFQDKIGCAIIHNSIEKKNQALSQMISLPTNFARLFDDGSITVKYGLKTGEPPTVVVVDLDGYIAHVGVGVEGIQASKAVIERILSGGQP